MSDSIPPEKHIEVTTTLGKIRGRSDVVALFVKAGNELAEAERQWIADLRSIGIKAAHPDDGWVNRKKSDHHDFVQLVYPQFNDGVKAGDKIALGWHDRYRVRTVQRVTRDGLIFKHDLYQVIK